MRALIVDDSLEVREVIAAYLVAAGYPDPVRAPDAETALRLLGIAHSGIAAAAAGAERIDVVLMDIMMPGMDGIEACARIKRNGATAEVPVVMVSSRDDHTALQQAFQAGASDYVRKPIERVELLARIRSALRLRAELERRRGQEDALRAELARLQASHAAAATDAATGLPSALVAAAVAEAAIADGRCVALLAIVADGAGPVGAAPVGGMPPDAAVASARKVADAVGRASAGLSDLLAAAPGRLLAVTVDRQAAEVQALAERIRLAVERARILRETPEGALASVSVGIAHADGDDWPGMLERAIRAANVASARGGNRVEAARPAAPERVRDRA
ncbi:response regulator [Stella sp.]|uniref:response regulator n=1 Tax=Stella sp. TaxID=2912054 RepID=UPI0035B0DCD0